ncbi:MAG: hypothetical protein JO217_12705 [Acidobacteriaceae bacterium]|nr:hypothetical protein [Acidobacteriaceae bacterium]
MPWPADNRVTARYDHLAIGLLLGLKSWNLNGIKPARMRIDGTGEIGDQLAEREEQCKAAPLSAALRVHFAGHLGVTQQICPANRMHNKRSRILSRVRLATTY